MAPSRQLQGNGISVLPGTWWCQQPKEAWKGSSQSLDKSSAQLADTLVSLTGLSG